MAHIHSMARQGRTDEVAGCINDGADVNALSARGETTLTLAASRGHLEVVDLLLRSGANPNLADSRDNTPLSSAVEGGWFDVVERLFAAGADPNGAGGFWGPPIVRAALRHNDEMFDRLVAAGADPNARGHKEMSATEWLEIGGIRGETKRLFPNLGPKQDEQGRFIADEGAHEHARKMMAEGLSPDEFMAKHGRYILVWSAARSVYSDPEVQAWVARAADVLFDLDKLAEAEERYLTGEELESARRHRKRLAQSQDRYKRRHRPRPGTDGVLSDGIT